MQAYGQPMSFGQDSSWFFLLKRFLKVSLNEMLRCRDCNYNLLFQSGAHLKQTKSTNKNRNKNAPPELMLNPLWPSLASTHHQNETSMKLFRQENGEEEEGQKAEKKRTP